MTVPSSDSLANLDRAIDDCFDSPCAMRRRRRRSADSFADELLQVWPPEKISGVRQALDHVHRGLSWVYVATQDAQREGDLRAVPAIRLHLGGMCGLIADSSPSEYLTLDPVLPDGMDRAAWSAFVYWADAVRHGDAGAFWEYHVCRAVGAACGQEIEDRLKRYPVEASTLKVLAGGGDAEEALQQAIREMERHIKNTGRDVPRDETPSVFNEALGTFLSKASSFEVWLRAVDGQIKSVLQHRFIDKTREARADFRTFDRPAAPGRSDNPIDVLASPTRTPPEEQPDRDEVLRLLGSAGHLVRFYQEHPDKLTWTDEKVAEAIGRTDRTVRNYRKTLKTTHRDLLLRIFQVKTATRQAGRSSKKPTADQQANE